VIAYFDTSAVIPLLVDDEPGAATARGSWLGADTVVTTRILFAEAAAALARAFRLGRLTSDALDQALAGLERAWAQFHVVEVDDVLVRTAGSLAREQALRGYDAVHCAAALRVAGPDTVAIAGDRDLLTAWQALGMPVIDTSV
jgi:predicted nucleic acid-binding protein